MFPSLLVLLHRVECFDLRLLAVQTALLNGCDHTQHTVIIVGQNFLELGQVLAEVVQDLLAAGGAGLFHMLPDQLFQGGHIILVLHRLQADGLLVDPLVEIPVLIQHIGDAAGHTGCKVLSNLSQYNEANGNMIELIICNNDNMAEGAISALEAAGYNTGAEGATTIPVFGVDATDAAKELIAAGKMTGTVKQDAEGMAVAIADVVKATGEGTAMADAVAATAGTNAEMYSIADGIANKLFVAYAAYTK